MIDIWKLTKDFAPGDFVQKFFPGWDSISPYMGRVIAVMPGLGALDVQWPFGAERVQADDVIKVNPQMVRWLPPSLDFSYYPGFDATRERAASKLDQGFWQTGSLPPAFHKDLASCWHKGFDDLSSYDELWHRYAAHGLADDESIRGAVAKFYGFGKRLADARIRMLGSKTAAYWVAQNRQYRVTGDEITVQRPACPRCKVSMRRTTYKMDKGSRLKLFACPKCLFLIKRDSLVGPDGQPVEW